MNISRIAIALVSLLSPLPPRADAAVRNGEVDIGATLLRAGSTVDLTGQWLYQPGYALQPGDNPAVAAASECVRVPVPQLLNRIHWWLDDSEDFKAHETARLKALGFDTDRAEDGWYYLRLDLPALPAGRHVSIEFDGVAMVSRTYCNGHLLGEHQGMFSRFDYDLTPHLQTGRNLLAVFVAMEKTPPSSLALGEAVTVNLTASKVKTLSKGMFGPLSPNFDNRAYDLHGIWQPVKLVVRDTARLDDVWFVPSLTGAEVRVTVHSFAATPGATLRAKWTDAKTGQLFAEISPENIELRPDAAAHTLTLRDVQPKLWTPAEPNLYRLDVTLESATGAVMDSSTHQVGFRTFEARGNKFFLNGHPYWLRGANHLPYGKNPWDAELARKLIQYLHDANVRVTRTHATPWNEAWLDAADEIGLGVSLEGIRPWALAGKIGATPPELFAHWLMENEDVVKRARNHPSVFIYTIGNEMLLRDTKNLEKWQQLSDVVKQTRRLDPARPVICSSEYTREAELYASLLRPNGIDDGDADDLHRYNNWYAPSSFVTDAKFEKEVSNNHGQRPLIGQEMSSGYPDLDTGLPVLRYTRDLLTPQAWVGPHAYPGSDPAIFLEHHRAVTKRWAERLRFERGPNTAGFMLFATECWFAHSYDAERVQPYPVVTAVREAWSPIGVALETVRRRFFAGEAVETAVFVTNDDERFRDRQNLRIELSIRDRQTARILQTKSLSTLASLRYYETVRLPVRFELPPADGHRRGVSLEFRVLADADELGRSTEPVEVFPRPRPPGPPLVATAVLQSVGPRMTRLAQDTFARVGETLPDGAAQTTAVILTGAESSPQDFAPGGRWRTAVEGGATAVWFNPGEHAVRLFPNDLIDAKGKEAEYADWTPIRGTKLADGLEPMDLKWWGRADDWRVFVAGGSHRLKPGGRARELLHHIPPHSYISADKIPEQHRTVLFELPLGRGRLWICDLDLEASVTVDPAARMFAENLLRAAATADSTRSLPSVPTHEELLTTK